MPLSIGPAVQQASQEGMHEMTAERLLIVGNGMAADRLLDELYHHCPGRYAITLCGEENSAAYNRILLSPYLTGEYNEQDLFLKTHHWYRERGIEVHLGGAVEQLHVEQGFAMTSDGRRHDFDRLVMATGSLPLSLGVEGEQLPGVMAFRTLADARYLRQLPAACRQVVVIGGGLLGIEAAYGLVQQGKQVTLLQRGQWLLNRQLDEVAGGYLQRHLQRLGIEVRLGVSTRRFIGAEHLEALELNDGEILFADLAVQALGVTPRTELARQAGLQVDKGILVNDQMATSASGVYALGECCQWQSQTFGLVAPIWDQARVLARSLAGEQDGYRYQDFATRLKVSGIDLLAAGVTSSNSCLTYEDREYGHYRRINLDEQGRISGIVLYGDVSAGNAFIDLMKQQKQVSHLGTDLLFGPQTTALEAEPEAVEDANEPVATAA